MSPRGPSWSLIFNPFSLLAFQTESTNSASSIVQNGCCLEALDPHEHAALCFCQATCSRRVVHFLSRRRKFWFESCKAQVQWRDIHPENWEEKAWIAVINICKSEETWARSFLPNHPFHETILRIWLKSEDVITHMFTVNIKNRGGGGEHVHGFRNKQSSSLHNSNTVWMPAQSSILTIPKVPKHMTGIPAIS
jgi:hypothetical protein